MYSNGLQRVHKRQTPLHFSSALITYTLRSQERVVVSVIFK